EFVAASRSSHADACRCNRKCSVQAQHRTDFGSSRRVPHRSSLPHHCAAREFCRVDATVAHNVKDFKATRDQMIGDNATMAAPPHRLGTHHDSSPFPPELDELLQPALEFR